ncbi:hypothetical protein Tco_1501170 [Tanacetum coccineum]
MDSPIGIPSGKHSRCCNTMPIAFGITLKLMPNVDCPNGHPVAEQHNYINTDITHEGFGINVASSVRNNGVNMSRPIELDIIDPYVVRRSAKVPMLKPGEYELCRMRMEQYIQMNELIISMWRKEELYSWASLINIMKFKRLKRSDKSLLQAVKKRFGGNAATKKTQRNLLKQQYKFFTKSSSEVLDQTFDRLQKLISQLGLWM